MASAVAVGIDSTAVVTGAAAAKTSGSLATMAASSSSVSGGIPAPKWPFITAINSLAIKA